MSHNRQDCLDYRLRITIWFHADGYVSVRQRGDELEEIAVTDQDESRPAAVNVYALPDQSEKSWVDDQLFVPVRLR